MMMNMTFALMAEGLSWSERFSTAGIVTLMGMVVIFAVLAILWGAIEIMHRLLHGKQEKADQPVEKAPKEKKVREKKAKPSKASAPAPTDDAAIAAAIAAALAATEDDGATVAAITAAISATLAEEGYTGGFRVVSFKRAGVHTRKRF